MKILVAVDGSDYTKRMLAYLAAHDEWLGDHHEYTLVHAVPAFLKAGGNFSDDQIVDWVVAICLNGLRSPHATPVSAAPTVAA